MSGSLISLRIFHSLLSTMTRLSWVALHGMAQSFIELDKAVVYVIRLVSFLWLWFSFCLEQLVIALCSSAVAYWTPSNLGGSSSGVISFCLFILFRGLSRQEYWGGLPFPPPVDHVLSELSTMTHHSWVALQSMAHSFTDLHKPLRMHRWFSGREFKQTPGDRGGQRSLACCSPWDHTESDMT